MATRSSSSRIPRGDDVGLPLLLAVRRIRNDLIELEDREDILVSDLGENISFPYSLKVRLVGVTGYVAPGKTADEHEFDVILGEDFPYERPKIRWKSEIFHPNIMSPSEGGGVCIADRDRWDFDSSLSDLILRIADLVKNPNPYNPLVSESCTAAAEWLKGNA